MTKPCYLNFKVDVKNRRRLCEIICDRLGIPFDVNNAIDFALAQTVFMTQAQPTASAVDLRHAPNSSQVSQSKNKE